MYKSYKNDIITAIVAISGLYLAHNRSALLALPLLYLGYKLYSFVKEYDSVMAEIREKFKD